jgi:GDP-4-dehydro-6-deoxy-D-mannose reductase
MTTLITGASGFIAQHVAGILQAAGQRVVGADLRATAKTRFDDWFVTDLTDEHETRQLVAHAKPTIVYHLVGLIRGTDEALYQSNVVTARNLLEVLQREAPSTRIVLVGSAAEYGMVPLEHQPVRESYVGAPVNTYGRTKRELSELAATVARERGQHVVIARPFNVIGAGVPDALVIGAIVKRLREALSGAPPRSITVGRTDSVRDFIAVEDVASALIAIGDRGSAGESYNVCTGEGHTIGEALDRLAALAGEAISFERDQSLMRSGDVDAMVGSWEKAQRDLGWSPRSSFEESLRRAWEG